MVGTNEAAQPMTASRLLFRAEMSEKLPKTKIVHYKNGYVGVERV